MTPTLPTSQRRAVPRQPLALSASVEHLARKFRDARGIEGRTRDVSNQGIYFWAPATFFLGDPLRLELKVPPEEARNLSLQISCEVEVLRVEPQAKQTGVAARIVKFADPGVIPAGPPKNSPDS